MVAPRKITDEGINKILELSLNSDMSRKEIANEVGYSHDTVWRYQKKFLKKLVY